MSFENPVYFRIMLIALAVAGGCLTGYGLFHWLLRRRVIVRVFQPIFLFLAGLSLALAGYAAWFNNRHPARPLSREIAPGIQYARLTGTLVDGAPYAAHLATIRTDRPGFRLALAGNPIPGAPTKGLSYSATPPTQLLRQTGATVLINGDFFGPWDDKGPFNYRPHAGQPCETRGLAVADGKLINEGKDPYYTHASLWIDSDRRIKIGEWSPVTNGFDDLQLAVSGAGVLVRDGQAQPGHGTPEFGLMRHPRAVAGLSADEKTLYFLVIDGRQPGYSEGMTWEETANFAIAQGLHLALMLDGGGSATLAARVHGQLRLLSCPIHNTIPGRQRPIANALVVY